MFIIRKFNIKHKKLYGEIGEKSEVIVIKFYDLLMRTDCNTKVTWWNTEKPADKGEIALFGMDAIGIKKLPKWLRNADVVVISADDTHKTSVGLDGIFKDE